MKNIILVFGISTFILFSCTKNKPIFSFCDNIYKINDENKCFTIKNNSSIKYAFFSPSLGINDEIKIILTDKSGIEPSINTLYLDDLYINEKEEVLFRVKEREDSLLWKSLINKGINVDYFWIKQYNSLKMNHIILNPHEEIKFSKKIALLKYQLKKSGSYYTFHKNKKYTIQVEINFDSIKIKKYLTPMDLDSLKRNNIKILTNVRN